MVESQTEETPLSFQRDSARVLRFMYLDFMESKTVHFVHSRKCENIQQPILVCDLAWTNPCEPEERAGDLLTNVDLTVLVLKAKGFWASE